jgi:hypothetical protein
VDRAAVKSVSVGPYGLRAVVPETPERAALLVEFRMTRAQLRALAFDALRAERELCAMGLGDHDLPPDGL